MLLLLGKRKTINERMNELIYNNKNFYMFTKNGFELNRKFSVLFSVVSVFLSVVITNTLQMQDISLKNTFIKSHTSQQHPNNYR